MAKIMNITTFPSLGYYRELSAGKITIEEYSRLDMSPKSQTIETIPQAPFPVELTQKAAEQLLKVMDQEETGLPLRLGVRGGGCSGLEFVLDFEEKTETDLEDVQYGINIVVDPVSATLMVGTTLEYHDGLMGSGFKFENTNFTRRCGCGASVGY